MPRIARLDTPGLLNHVMIRGIERRKIFNDDQDRKDYFRAVSYNNKKFVLRVGRLLKLNPQPVVLSGKSLIEAGRKTLLADRRISV